MLEPSVYYDLFYRPDPFFQVDGFDHVSMIILQLPAWVALRVSYVLGGILKLL